MTMPMGIMYWVLMLLWFVLYLATSIGAFGFAHSGIVNGVLLFLLFLLLGWKVFGKPVQ
jgi:hypothetical protein